MIFKSIYDLSVKGGKHMKKYGVTLVAIVIILLFLLPAAAFAGKKSKKRSSGYWRSKETIIISKAVGERKWLLGKIKGNGNVITVKLEHLTNPSDHYQLETSTNKFGHYAFSDVGQGNPSEYKLVIYSGDTMVKQVSLKGIRRGGTVPDIAVGW